MPHDDRFKEILRQTEEEDPKLELEKQNNNLIVNRFDNIHIY